MQSLNAKGASMIYTIENDKFSVSVDTSGAQLQSMYSKTTKTEYIWQGDSKYWTGRAYNLFPICGRLTEGKYTWQGKTYEMNLHGFARKSQYTMVAQTENSLTFRLETSEQSLAVYPFDFCLDLTYTLEGKTIREVALFVAQRLAPLEAVLSTATHFVLRKYKDKGVIYGPANFDERGNCN